MQSISRPTLGDYSDCARSLTPLQLAWVIASLSICTWLCPNVGVAQQAVPPSATDAQSTSDVADEVQRLATDAAANRNAAADQAANAKADANTPRGLNFFQLLMDGGPLMIPLVLTSILVLAVSLERLINLRIGRILPRKMRRGLVEAAEQRYPVEPQELYQMGLRNPSVASRSLESVLKKVGRPIPEMEAALQDSCQREAERLYATVRWLTAAAAIAPLLGLLGTVWGMILAFFETTQPGLGLNRTQQLAQGISIAFVNTLAGLSIAIPAAAFSHFFEGRIVKLMGLVQELIQGVIPRLERFEGVTRFDLERVGLVPRQPQHQQNSTSPTSGPPTNQVRGTLVTPRDPSSSDTERFEGRGMYSTANARATEPVRRAGSSSASSAAPPSIPPASLNVGSVDSAPEGSATRASEPPQAAASSSVPRTPLGR